MNPSGELATLRLDHYDERIRARTKRECRRKNVRLRDRNTVGHELDCELIEWVLKHPRHRVDDFEREIDRAASRVAQRFARQQKRRQSELSLQLNEFELHAEASAELVDENLDAFLKYCKSLPRLKRERVVGFFCRRGRRTSNTQYRLTDEEIVKIGVLTDTFPMRYLIIHESHHNEKKFWRSEARFSQRVVERARIATVLIAAVVAIGQFFIECKDRSFHKLATQRDSVSERDLALASESKGHHELNFVQVRHEHPHHELAIAASASLHHELKECC